MTCEHRGFVLGRKSYGREALALRLGSIPHWALWNAATADIRATPRKAIVGMLHFGGHVGNHQLLCFSTFVNVCLLDSSPYRGEKRVAARRSMHIA